MSWFETHLVYLVAARIIMMTVVDFLISVGWNWQQFLARHTLPAIAICSEFVLYQRRAACSLKSKASLFCFRLKSFGRFGCVCNEAVMRPSSDFLQIILDGDIEHYAAAV